MLESMTIGMIGQGRQEAHQLHDLRRCEHTARPEDLEHHRAALIKAGLPLSPVAEIVTQATVEKSAAKSEAP